MAPGGSPPISAGDLEKYGYCPLNWWLSLGKADGLGPETIEGERRHEEVAAELKGIEVHEVRARESERTVMYFAVGASIVALLGMGFFTPATFQVAQILVVVALIWILAAVFFLYRAETLVTPEQKLYAERTVLLFSMVAAILASVAVSFLATNHALAQAAVVAALVWLIGASWFLYRSMRSLEAARTAREKHRIGESEVRYVDSEGEKPKLFVSKRHGLTGRPDAVLMAGEAHVPVEVKTGRTPRGPLFSHILQIAAYCLLMEEEYGRPPPYGIIRYEGASHEIEYNEDLRTLVLGKIGEMRGALARGGGAHRNHNRPGKCLGCSRREGCPERLA
ncbi:MAG: Dna2/Cas4 domain-containing protein [Methanobacteriota archaeon]|nr:MAG: Dna2/Cas4 domain-containing protein [Euryarchaeota archaeon]